MTDWRTHTLAHIRDLIQQADPDAAETVKWKKPTNPAGLFNAGFGGNTRRAIDIREGESIDEAAFKALIRAAVDANVSKGS